MRRALSIAIVLGASVACGGAAEQTEIDLHAFLSESVVLSVDPQSIALPIGDAQALLIRVLSDAELQWSLLTPSATFLDESNITSIGGTAENNHVANPDPALGQVVGEYLLIAIPTPEPGTWGMTLSPPVGYSEKVFAAVTGADQLRGDLNGTP